MSYQTVKPFPGPETLTKALPPLWDWVVGLMAISGLLVLIYTAVTGAIFRTLPGIHGQPGWMSLIVRPSILWATMGYLLLLFRTFFWIRYKPWPRCNFDAAPSLTVVIPAYNEGSMVELTINSVANALYPRDRLEIIVVDDGSRDDTWLYMQKAARLYPGLVTAIRFKENRGKRAALAEAFRIARGEIVTTIDSDSVIERDALLELVGPFRDSAIGAVAGKVVAYNRNISVIPKMLHVRFILSFDFLRAVQSTYGT
ncbi:MAG TPA: glycosyltransferase family 2 protein, partial [Dissulfurispiraceae bacterium]|nr:glycosyltransferase family 2 protein [Dissulfurispiraceae bacterium]